MIKRFKLYPEVTTRQVNAVIRKSMDQAIRELGPFTGFPEPDYRRDRVRNGQGRRRHVFGWHTALRDTLVASHEGGSDIIEVVFPNNYQGWDKTGSYDRMRVRAYDLILHAKITDPLGKVDTDA